jgi:large subunit ribosomal protein L6
MLAKRASAAKSSRGSGDQQMSRIGRKPIPVPAGVIVNIEPELVTVNGPKGELSERVNRDIVVTQEGEELLVSRPTDRGEHRALHGLTRSLVANMVEGVTNGYQKSLEIQGVGYRAVLKGKDLELALGYSHPVPIPAPAGIEFEVPQPTRVVVKGISKQQVGETAAFIRKQRPPEPYKGKGIRYEGEYVARKVGKRA